MSISSSANDRKQIAVTRAKETGITTPITLSERSITGFALIRIFVGYLWFQQLFWKMPPNFRGLYPYIIRESQHTIIPGYGYILQHTFLGGCSSRAKAGRRSMACTTSTSSRTAASHSAHCELVCVGREREGYDANTTQGSGGRASCRPRARHARLC